MSVYRPYQGGFGVEAYEKLQAQENRLKESAKRNGKFCTHCGTPYCEDTDHSNGFGTCCKWCGERVCECHEIERSCKKCKKSCNTKLCASCDKYNN